MADALRMEWIRIRTVRSTYVLSAIGLLLGLAVAAVLAAALRGEDLDTELIELLITSGSIVSPLPFVAVMAGVIGVLAVGHDYRHGLVQPVLLAVPRRRDVVLARLVVLTGVALLLAVTSMVINLIVGVAVAGAFDADSSTARVVLGYLLYVVVWAWLGAGLTWLLRNTAGVLVLLLLVPLILEPLLTGLTFIPALEGLQPAARWLPFTAGKLLLIGDTNELTEVATRAQSSLLAGLDFVIFALVLVAGGAARFFKQDA